MYRQYMLVQYSSQSIFFSSLWMPRREQSQPHQDDPIRPMARPIYPSHNFHPFFNIRSQLTDPFVVGTIQNLYPSRHHH